MKLKYLLNDYKLNEISDTHRTIMHASLEGLIDNAFRKTFKSDGRTFYPDATVTSFNQIDNTLNYEINYTIGYMIKGRWTGTLDTDEELEQYLSKQKFRTQLEKLLRKTDMTIVNIQFEPKEHGSTHSLLLTLASL